MRPPITTIPGISADWSGIGKPMRAANDPGIDAAVQEREDEGRSVVEFKAPPTKPPTQQP